MFQRAFIYLNIYFFVCISPLLSQTVTKSFAFDSLERSYRLHTPPTYDEIIPVPLMLNFHGLNSSAIIQEVYSQMSVVADSAGFIVAYPEGIDQRWNVNIDDLENDSIDDVGFVSALIDTIVANYNIDTNRIYASGFSLGGFMCYRLACELSHRISAITSVSGLMSEPLLQNCHPTRSVSITQIHGTNDQVVAYNGDNQFLSVDRVMDFWREKYECDIIPAVTPITDEDPTDGSSVVRINYICALEPTELVLFIINNGGHTWPGSPIVLDGDVPNGDIDASHEIWTFVKKHSLNEVPTNVQKPDLSTQIQVFPNPANSWVMIQSKKVIREVKIYDINGSEQICSFTKLPRGIKANVSHLSTGLYMLKILTPNDSAYIRLVKM